MGGKTMKKKLLICLLLVLVLSLVAGAASAKGSKNSVYIKFFGSVGGWVDSWWHKTGSGLVHEWKVMPNGDRQHLVFKPVSKFKAPDCDDNAFRTAWNWKAVSYTHHPDSDGDMSDFLTVGRLYHICYYPW
jgi:hypothetical protein